MVRSDHRENIGTVATLALLDPHQDQDIMG